MIWELRLPIRIETRNFDRWCCIYIGELRLPIRNWNYTGFGIGGNIICELRLPIRNETIAMFFIMKGGVSRT